MAYLQLVGGLIYVLMGGDLLVRGAVALARRVRVPPVFIALSVVAFGTSVPELVVTVSAVFSGYPSVAMGNVVGSNIANVLLVVGVPALLHPLSVEGDAGRRDSAVALVAGALLALLCIRGSLHRVEGVFFLVLLGGVLVLMARAMSRTQEAADRETPLEWVLGLPSRGWMIALFIAAGSIGLPLGARMFVEAAVTVARDVGVSDAVAGLTIVALGTSLPELGTCVMAVVRGESEVALGTAIGSNIFNVLAIMGISAAVSPVPIPVPFGFLSLDLPVMVAGAALLTVVVWRRRPVGRWMGAALVTGYVGYLGALLHGG